MTVPRNRRIRQQPARRPGAPPASLGADLQTVCCPSQDRPKCCRVGGAHHEHRRHTGPLNDICRQRARKVDQSTLEARSGFHPRATTAAPDATAHFDAGVPVSTAKSTASSVSTSRSLRAVPTATVGTAAVPSGVLGLVLTGVAELGLAATVSVASAIVPSPTVLSPTLSLNGYKVVPSSPETVTSLYGTVDLSAGCAEPGSGHNSNSISSTRKPIRRWALSMLW